MEMLGDALAKGQTNVGLHELKAAVHDGRRDACQGGVHQHALEGGPVL